jgi:putative ATP-dependent endonuclease of OLD family
MFLEQIEIVGFRGISRLSVNLGQTTALIGENAWGKSSMLRALWSLLGHDALPYQFVAEDFYRAKCDGHHGQTLSIRLTFREHRPGISQHSNRLNRLSRIWTHHHLDMFHRIHYVAKANLNADGIASEHYFEDANGNRVQGNNSAELIRLLSAMNPVLRLRDSRAISALAEPAVGPDDDVGDITDLLPDCSPDRQQQITDGVHAAEHLLDRYFMNVPHQTKRSQRDIINQPGSLHGLTNWHDLLRNMDNDTMQQMLARIGHALLSSYSGRKLDHEVRPIYILEDPESRLHPTMLTIAWGLIQQLPGQKILTTNSGDLLATLPLSQIRRLVRTNGTTQSHQMDESRFTADDLRKLTFHVRINRPMALFARCWILVEGETELWLLSELAQLCGYHLLGEGVRIIEYAQCGYSPLIKLANDLGISWHMLADGDEAGVRYVQGARRLMAEERQHNSNTLTLLPNRDIEHFLFTHGFEEVYRREAGKVDPRHMPMSKIIERAVSRRSKPGMALAVIEEAMMLGVNSVPALLQNMFSRVVTLARQQA